MLEVPGKGAGPVKILVLDQTPELLAEELVRAFPNVEPICCSSYEQVHDRVFTSRPQAALTYRIGPGSYPRGPLMESGILEWVHVGGAGVDHLIPWDATNVTVTNSSGIHGDMIAQYALCAMLMFNQNMPAYVRGQRARNWAQLESRTLAGQTVLVIGFGRIGEEIGGLCRKLKMRVIGVRSQAFQSDMADFGIGFEDLPEMIHQADHVLLSLPLTSRTRTLIGPELLERMKPGTHLINVARGGIVEEAALIAALDAGILAHATMDVFGEEPLPDDDPLWSHPSVTITPHVSSNVVDWKWRVLDVFKRNLGCWLGGRPLQNVILPERGY